jgi:alkyldihydroxyacetonephosphate synthase
MRHALIALLGAESVFDDPESLATASASWFPPRLKRRGAFSRWVARPADTNALSRLLHWASENRATIAPHGGGSSLVHAPDADIALDLTRLDAVDWDESSLLVTAGAGVRLGDLEDQLLAHGYTLGALPRSARLATVGGAVATNAVGVLSGRYGRLADTALGLTAVLADGTIVRTRAAPGAQAAFDLHALFIGSEGIYGVIAEATLAIFPVPDVRAWAVFDFARRADAVESLRLIARSDSQPTLARVDSVAARARVLLGFEGDEIVQTGNYQLAHAICQQLGGTPQSPEIGDAWFDARERSDALAANAHPNRWADALAFGATWTTLSDTIECLAQALEGRVAALDLAVTHPTPHGACVEATVTIDGDEAHYRRLLTAAIAAATEAGAICAHHYGVGVKLRDAFLAERGPEGAAVLHALKSALDPHGVLPAL